MSKETQQDAWKRMSFKGNKVWVQTEDTGELKVVKDRVLIKYNLKQDYEYQVKPDSLKPENQAVPSKKKDQSKKRNPKRKSARTSMSINSEIDTNVPDNCIKIYTDGASSGNPGPAGIGALLIYKDNKKEISKSIGDATNNIAELTAIKVALQKLKRNDLPVRIYSDSSYAIGVLTKEWKPKTNQNLVCQIKQMMMQFADLEFIKVKGHSGIKENEVADYLAASAIKKKA